MKNIIVRKNKLVNLLFLISIVIFSCTKAKPGLKTKEDWKLEIQETEEKFKKLAQEEGIAKAFETFAAEDAVINRGNKIIQGRSAIADWCKNAYNENQKLTWKPDFIEVSVAGDLAYTYGSYVFTDTDSTGVASESTGIFHSVWKRQADGSWKFVWD